MRSHLRTAGAEEICDRPIAGQSGFGRAELRAAIRVGIPAKTWLIELERLHPPRQTDLETAVEETKLVLRERGMTVLLDSHAAVVAQGHVGVFVGIDVEVLFALVLVAERDEMVFSPDGDRCALAACPCVRRIARRC